MLQPTNGAHGTHGVRGAAPAAGLHRRWRAAALLVASLLVSACAVNGEPPVLVATPLTGQVIVDWTIRGAKDAADCQASGATTIHVSLADYSGLPAMEYVQDCAAFAITIDGVAPDTYAGTVELLDASGNPRTTSVNLAPFTVTSATTITVAVDFPANSFF
jgi:hypothetical protein